MDMLVLGNSASNFVVYCLMSTKFRRTLLKVDHLGRVPPPILNFSCSARFAGVNKRERKQESEHAKADSSVQKFNGIK